MIKLMAKKKLGFRDPNTKKLLVVQPYAFETVPDWVAHDNMFKLALASGDLNLVTDQPVKPTAEPKAESKKAAKKEEAAK